MFYACINCRFYLLAKYPVWNSIFSCGGNKCSIETLNSHIVLFEVLQEYCFDLVILTNLFIPNRTNIYWNLYVYLDQVGGPCDSAYWKEHCLWIKMALGGWEGSVPEWNAITPVKKKHEIKYTNGSDLRYRHVGNVPHWKTKPSLVLHCTCVAFSSSMCWVMPHWNATMSKNSPKPYSGALL